MDRDARIAELEAALTPFARVWRINAQLEPDLKRPMREFVPGAWLLIADCKRASDLLPETL